MYVFFVIKITNLIQDFGSKMLYHLTVSLDDRLRRRQYHVELLCIDCLITLDNYVCITITGSIPLLVDY